MVDAYRRAGVDLEAGYEVVSRIKKHVRRTTRPGALGSVGGFGAHTVRSGNQDRFFKSQG